MHGQRVSTQQSLAIELVEFILELSPISSVEKASPNPCNRTRAGVSAIASWRLLGGVRALAGVQLTM